MQRLYLEMSCADPEWGTGVRTPPLIYHIAIGFLSNTGLYHLKSNKATKPTFNVGPSSSSKRNAILMAFRFRAENDPLLVVFGPSLPSTINQKEKEHSVRVGPPLTRVSGSANECYATYSI